MARPAGPSADAVADAGNEAKQRREITLFDNEQLELFESILRCSVAEKQREDGAQHLWRRMTLSIFYL